MHVSYHMTPFAAGQILKEGISTVIYSVYTSVPRSWRDPVQCSSANKGELPLPDLPPLAKEASNNLINDHTGVFPLRENGRKLR